MDLSFSNYGQEREINCTPEERTIFNFVAATFPDDDLKLVRVSDNYVTVRRGVWDIVRLKFTRRAKWLMFPTAESGQKKHYIERPAQIEDCVDIIRESIETAKKYED